MNRGQVFGSLSLALSALTVWLYIVLSLSPDKSDGLLLSAFFVSLWVWLGSGLAAALYWYKVKQSNREVIYAHIKPSIRQGFIMAGTVCILLFLQLLRVLSPWDGVIVIFVALAFEIAAQQSRTTTIVTKKATS